MSFMSSCGLKAGSKTHTHTHTHGFAFRQFCSRRAACRMCRSQDSTRTSGRRRFSWSWTTRYVRALIKPSSDSGMVRVCRCRLLPVGAKMCFGSSFLWWSKMSTWVRVDSACMVFGVASSTSPGLVLPCFFFCAFLLCPEPSGTLSRTMVSFFFATSPCFELSATAGSFLEKVEQYYTHGTQPIAASPGEPQSD